MQKTIFTEWPQVVEAASLARNRGLATTNFYADEERMRQWCRDESFSAVRADAADFFLHEMPGFTAVFYFASDAESLGSALQALTAENSVRRLVMDVIGPDPMRAPIVAQAAKAGFAQISELVRMSRKTPEDSPSAPSNVTKASEHDLAYIHAALQMHFMPEIDQLPTEEELARWAQRGAVHVCRGDDGAPAGFVIYDLLPSSLYLRYWFVEPAMRGKGVGSALMNAMFAAAASTRRQYFWVKTDNANAIDKYRHYGFAFERIKDTILACGSK